MYLTATFVMKIAIYQRKASNDSSAGKRGLMENSKSHIGLNRLH